MHIRKNARSCAQSSGTPVPIKFSLSITFWFFGLLVLPAAAVAEEVARAEMNTDRITVVEEFPEAKIYIDNTFVSNWVDRGTDLHSGYAEQRGVAYGESTGAPAWQPNIIFDTPVDGLSFSIWATVALAGREDRDADRKVQYRPGGSDIYRDKWHYWVNADGNKYGPSGAQFGSIPGNAAGTLISDLKKNFATVALQLQEGEEITNDQGTYDTADDTEIGIAGFYKEKNGLKRADEMEFRLDHIFQTRKGAVEFGILSLIHPGVEKDGYGEATEFFVSFAPTAIPFMSIGVKTDEDTSDTYTTLAFDPELHFSDDLGLAFHLSSTHASRQKATGLMWSQAGIELRAGGFHIGLHGVYRHDWRFYDEDGFNTSAPLWIAGGSTTADGLVEDPSRSRGMYNAWANAVTEVVVDEALGRQAATDFEYTYTARQKLPRVLYWVSMGYTVEI